MRIVTIGGGGHIGTYLVPRLVEAGHAVTNVSRGVARPYLAHPAWRGVTQVTLDRTAAEGAGTFGAQVAALGADVVVDLICFTPDSAAHLAAALEGRVSHLVHVGTIWVHGHSTTVPTRESDPRVPFGDYGIAKSVIEDMLIARSRAGGLTSTVVRPGHIVGPGWAPLNPAGHFNPDVFRAIRDGEELCLPNFGLETVHHVHAEDVARLIHAAIDARNAAAGEAFNAVSPAAITLRHYAEAMFRWHGHAPRLRFAPFDDWARGVTEEEAAAARDHIARSPCHSGDKARRLLGHVPRWTSLDAVRESVTALGFGPR